MTGRELGTADASARTRAVLALRGLLALPAREARYYTAATDDAGQPLDGRCRYIVFGGPLPGRWWSMTAYDREGYLIANAAGLYSVNSATIRLDGDPADRPGPGTFDVIDSKASKSQPHPEGPVPPKSWSVTVGPQPAGGVTNWLPTGGIERFELTLRTYLPPNGGKGDPSRSGLPSITREGC